MPGPGTNWKQLIVGGIITFVITVLAAAVFYLLTTKEPNLTYSISEGPVLPVKGEYKQIYVLRVRNTGRKEVLKVQARVAVKEGKIEAGDFRGSSGLSPQVRAEPKLYEVLLPDLNEGEQFTVSLMLIVPRTTTRPTFSVRGSGIVGKLREEGAQRSSIYILIISVFAGSLATMVVMLISIRFTRVFTLGDKNVELAYILTRCGLHEESATVRFAPPGISYFGTAEFILGEALKVSKDQRKPHSAALKCMLLIRGMLTSSKEVVKRAIRLIDEVEGEYEQLSKIEQGAPHGFVSDVQLRDEFDRLIAEEGLDV